MSKRLGNLYEQMFFTEALNKDLEVFTPLGDYLPQDCITMNTEGRLHKIQIKGTSDKVSDPSRGGLGRYMITTATGSGIKQSISPNDVDYIACYIKPSECWYIIPVPAIDSRIRISLYPHNPNSKAKHEKYKDAWNLIC